MGPDLYSRVLRVTDADTRHMLYILTTGLRSLQLVQVGTGFEIERGTLQVCNEQVPRVRFSAPFITCISPYCSGYTAA